MATVYTFTGPDGQIQQWRDRKRLGWAMSVVYPLLPLLGLWAHQATGAQILLGLPLLISYGLMPLLDFLIGEDENNPPEAVVDQLDFPSFPQSGYRVLFEAVGGRQSGGDMPEASGVSDKEEMPEIQLEDVSELRSKSGEEEVPF